MSLTLSELDHVRLPDVNLTYTSLAGSGWSLTGGYIATLSLSTVDPSTVYLHVTLDALNERRALPQAEVEDLLNGSLSVDQFFQSPDFVEWAQSVVTTLVHREVGTPDVEVKYQWETYVPQALNMATIGTNLWEETKASAFVKRKDPRPIPSYYQVKTIPGFVPNQNIFDELQFHVANGDPAIALVGPTGVGKSEMARYMGAALGETGYAVFTIDCAAHVKSENLFDMVDITAESGLIVRLGSLCTAAKETAELKCKLFVVMDEWNALEDESRRLFYPLFGRHHRYHRVQHTKGGEYRDPVDFSHVTFLLTANPPDINYLTDDLKPMSNAEVRRLVIIDMAYDTDPGVLEAIFKGIVTRLPSYRRLVKKEPKLEEQIPWTLGVRLFSTMNDKSGAPVPYDVGYSAVAQTLWEATAKSCAGIEFRVALRSALDQYCFNGIADRSIREALLNRASQCGVPL